MFNKFGPQHAGARLSPALGELLNWKGGFFVLEFIVVAVVNVGTGRLYMENIFNKALPNLPKHGPFYWTQSVEIFGVCLGVYPTFCATTCCYTCCAPGKNCCGQGTWDIRGACVAYTIFFWVMGFFLSIFAIINSWSCFPAYIWETTVRFTI
eukprot:SAG11_NODE_2218_length_3676_cov_3.617557_4_plen_152_part_00